MLHDDAPWLTRGIFGSVWVGSVTVGFWLVLTSGLGKSYAWILSGLGLGTGVKFVSTFFFVFCLTFVCPSIPAHLGAKALSYVYNSQSTITYTPTAIVLLDTDDDRDIRCSPQRHVVRFTPRSLPPTPTVLHTSTRQFQPPLRNPLALGTSRIPKSAGSDVSARNPNPDTNPPRVYQHVRRTDWPHTAVHMAGYAARDSPQPQRKAALLAPAQGHAHPHFGPPGAASRVRW